ncbi:MAG: hypothetical protein H5U40_17445, partial [Polyangiaceae bacterium]|nr:hypothetical protein [Polyangiaceae bacterium]
TLKTGARYEPAADRWSPTTERGAFARDGLVGAWTGDAMIVIGEPSDGDEYPPPSIGVYEPGADRWTSFSGTALLERPAIFTGTELLLFSGFDGSNLAPEGDRLPVPIAAASAP